MHFTYVYTLLPIQQGWKLMVPAFVLLQDIFQAGTQGFIGKLFWVFNTVIVSPFKSSSLQQWLFRGNLMKWSLVTLC